MSRVIWPITICALIALKILTPMLAHVIDDDVPKSVSAAFSAIFVVAIVAGLFFVKPVIYRRHPGFFGFFRDYFEFVMDFWRR